MFPDFTTPEERDKLRWSELEEDLTTDTSEQSTPDSELTENLYDEQFNNVTIRKFG
jgi:hypothetical protein